MEPSEQPKPITTKMLVCVDHNLRQLVN